jgi:phage/plasmid primase-like uncharacterized protein
MADLDLKSFIADLKRGAGLRDGDVRRASIDAPESFRAAILQNLGYAPRKIIGDGKLHRFSTSKRARDAAGYYTFHDDDFPAGSFGNWRSGQKGKWRAREAYEMSPEDRTRLEQVVAARTKKAEADRAQAIAHARARWDRAEPANADHPYLKRKGVDPWGLRQESGRLLVPIFAGGDLVSVQAIGRDGDKKYHPGAPTTGGSYQIDGAGDTFIIAEGFATAATLRQATGSTVIVAFTAHNLEAIARSVREREPDKTIIIAADDDCATEIEIGKNPGLLAAQKAADAIGATIAIPPFMREEDGDKPSDWNDFQDIYGAADVAPAFQYVTSGAQEADAAHAGTGGAKPDLLNGFMFDGDAPLEPPPMLVKKLVPFDGICFVGGQSGAGKTFIAVDLAVSLASGEPFFGHKVTERVGVAIFAAEGSSTIPSRITVARNHKAQGEILPITWLGAVPNLADEKEVQKMLPRLREVDARFRTTHGVRLGAVICDTLAASFDLNDENDNSEAAKAIRAMKTISDALGVVMVPVHHFGKDAGTGLRGASAWRAGCDVVISVLADRDQTTGQCSKRRIALTKSRVGEEGWVAPFELCFVEIGKDDDGEVFGACYVEPGNAEDAVILTTMRKEKGPPHYAKVYLDALGVMIGDKGRKVWPFGSEGPAVVAVDREDIRSEFYRRWAADGDDEKTRSEAKRKAFNRGGKWATDKRRIASYEVGKQHMVWFLKDADQ